MPRCEDFPCCGHEAGCCPSFDAAGNQTDMVCTCGARLPVNNRYSICDTCLSREDESTPFDYYDEEEYDEDEEEYDRDVILERQELEDFENCPYEDGGDFWQD